MIVIGWYRLLLLFTGLIEPFIRLVLLLMSIHPRLFLIDYTYLFVSYKYLIECNIFNFFSLWYFRAHLEQVTFSDAELLSKLTCF